MVPGHQATPVPAEHSEPIPVAVFPDLNGPQSRGQECVVCHAHYLVPDDQPVPDSVVVGRSGSTGRLVRACRERCAPAIGYVAPPQAVQETLL